MLLQKKPCVVRNILVYVQKLRNVSFKLSKNVKFETSYIGHRRERQSAPRSSGNVSCQPFCASIGHMTNLEKENYDESFHY